MPWEFAGRQRSACSGASLALIGLDPGSPTKKFVNAENPQRDPVPQEPIMFRVSKPKYNYVLPVQS